MENLNFVHVRASTPTSPQAHIISMNQTFILTGPIPENTDNTAIAATITIIILFFIKKTPVSFSHILNLSAFLRAFAPLR